MGYLNIAIYWDESATCITYLSDLTKVVDVLKLQEKEKPKCIQLNGIITCREDIATLIDTLIDFRQHLPLKENPQQP